MIGKKIGNLEDIIKKDSDLKKYILMGALDEISLGGEYKNPKDDFNLDVKKEVNTIMIRTLEGNRLSISLNRKTNSGGEVTPMVTVVQLIIHYGKDGFPVYDSEY